MGIFKRSDPFKKKLKKILSKKYNLSRSVVYYYLFQPGNHGDVRKVFKQTMEEDLELYNYYQPLVAKHKPRGSWAVVKALQKEVNARITYKIDNDNWGAFEYWARPIEVHRRGFDDCLMGDSPLIICNKGGFANIVQVADLIPENFPENKRYYLPEDLYVLSTPRFTKINWLIKKRTSKYIYRIRTRETVFDVTEDHKIFCKTKGLLNGSCEFVEAKSVKKRNIITLKRDYTKSFRDQGYDYDLGWVYGLFSAEGHCSGSIWNITNTNKDILEKAANILNGRRFYKLRNIKFKIKLYDCERKGCSTNKGIRNHNLYRLVARGNQRKNSSTLAEFVNRFRDDCYTLDGKKKTPVFILNSSKECKQGFLDGHYVGDAHCSTSKILMFGLVCLHKMIGMDMTIKDCINRNYSLYPSGKSKRKTYNSKKLGKTEEYVYDLNVNHPESKFCVGDTIVHNCDGYAILLCYVLRLFGFTEYETSVAVGYVYKENLIEKQYHAYCVVLDMGTMQYYPIEGSWYPSLSVKEAKHKKVSWERNLRYDTPDWMTNDKISMSRSLLPLKFLRKDGT